MKGDIVDCGNCGKSFEQRRRDHLFCNEHCRYQDWCRRHPRVEISKGFKIVPYDPAGNPTEAKEKA
jgi:hypothetical protein